MYLTSCQMMVHVSHVTYVVGFLSKINAPATELATVQEILIHSDALWRTSPNQCTIVLVHDQALRSKATEILWRHREKYPHIELRLGSFHTVMNVMSILVCIESEVFVDGTIAKVAEGNKYPVGFFCLSQLLVRVECAMGSLGKTGTTCRVLSA